MEDFFSVAYQQTEDERDLEYAFFGIYDGHGGAEAAAYAKEHLMEAIVRHKNFWSDSDEDVLRAIKDGYIATHYAMWKEQGEVMLFQHCRKVKFVVLLMAGKNLHTSFI